MLSPTIRPNRVRFISGATAERVQARRDAAAIKTYREARKVNDILNALELSISLRGH